MIKSKKSLKPFPTMHLSLPPENIKKPFQGVEKECVGKNGLMENFIFVQCQDPKTDSPATYTFLFKLLF